MDRKKNFEMESNKYTTWFELSPLKETKRSKVELSKIWQKFDDPGFRSKRKAGLIFQFFFLLCIHFHCDFFVFCFRIFIFFLISMKRKMKNFFKIDRIIVGWIKKKGNRQAKTFEFTSPCQKRLTLILLRLYCHLLFLSHPKKEEESNSRQE